MLNRLKSIVALMDGTKLPKVYWKALVKLPYTKRQSLLDIGLGTPKVVGNYLIELEEKGFLKSVKVGREKPYLNYKLMKVLEHG